MIRSFALADIVTLGNASCGTGAIFSALAFLDDRNTRWLWIAFALLPIALVCDVLDGSIARWRRKHSALGADLDSLADVVSFGVAPAVLGFTMGMRGGWDAVLLLYFVGCGISRLARYNVTAAELSAGTGKVKYYEGTPIPTSLALALVLAIGFAQGRIGDHLWFGVVQLGPWKLHPLAFMYAVSGSFMISTIRIPKP
jgi:CDP-diacylglycerol--serine O-phosphatidyltransferase